jgi:cyclohexadienyl dehydratase
LLGCCGRDGIDRKLLLTLARLWETLAMARMLIAALMLLFSLLHAQAESGRLDAIIASGKLRVGIPGDYRPFALRDPVSGNIEGFDIDMAASLAASLAVKLEFVATKWADLLTDLAADKFDIGMGGISITLMRQRAAYFSAPVLRTGKSAITRCSEKARFPDLAAIDRPGVKVITNSGGTNEKFDRANLKAAEIIVFPDNTGIWGELIAGRTDVMITDNVEARLQQKLHPQLCAVRPEAPFDFGELGYMLPRDASWKLYVDQWLHILTENGEEGRLLAKWLN